MDLLTKYLYFFSRQQFSVSCFPLVVISVKELKSQGQSSNTPRDDENVIFFQNVMSNVATVLRATTAILCGI